MLRTYPREGFLAGVLVLRVPVGRGHGDADGVHNGLQITVVPAHLQLVAVEVGAQVPGPTLAEPEGYQVTGPYLEVVLTVAND